MTKTLIEIRSVHKAMTLLGTDREIALMFDTTDKAVNNWRSFDWFPSKVAFRIQHELNQRGFFVSPKLLGQTGCKELRISRVCE
jgi:hypothetical protein